MARWVDRYRLSLGPDWRARFAAKIKFMCRSGFGTGFHLSGFRVYQELADRVDAQMRWKRVLLRALRGAVGIRRDVHVAAGLNLTGFLVEVHRVSVHDHRTFIADDDTFMVWATGDHSYFYHLSCVLLCDSSWEKAQKSPPWRQPRLLKCN